MCLLFIAASFARKRKRTETSAVGLHFSPNLKMCVKNVTEQLEKFIPSVIMGEKDLVFECHLC